MDARDETSRAARTMEQRNRTFRVLYDTVVEVEGASEEEVYAILCRNLRRISGARLATLSSYDSVSTTLTLEAVDREGGTARPRRGSEGPS